jgi:hypothetical protein
LVYLIFFRVEEGHKDEQDSASRKKPIPDDIYKVRNEIEQNQNKHINFCPNSLYVYQVLQTGIPLPSQTTSRHIYEGNGIFTKQDAINISVKRGSSFDLNTVFKKPNNFKKCSTDDEKYPILIISNHPVQAYQCVRSHNGKWEAFNLGKVYAIFAMDGSHFPGYLYKSIKWP